MRKNKKEKKKGGSISLKNIKKNSYIYNNNYNSNYNINYNYNKLRMEPIFYLSHSSSSSFFSFFSFFSYSSFSSFCSSLIVINHIKWYQMVFSFSSVLFFSRSRFDSANTSFATIPFSISISNSFSFSNCFSISNLFFSLFSFLTCSM